MRVCLYLFVYNDGGFKICSSPVHMSVALHTQTGMLMAVGFESSLLPAASRCRTIERWAAFINIRTG